VFTGEEVRPQYPEPVPELGDGRTIQRIRLAGLADLVRMKLTSFRAKDEAHLNDLDEAGLITRDIEEGLSPVVLERLARVRPGNRGGRSSLIAAVWLATFRSRAAPDPDWDEA
jgi:hypothetical protein